MPRIKKPVTGNAARSSDRDSDAEHNSFLASIDKLLGTVAELMKKEPALDRQAFEHLRALRVRIRFAMGDRASYQAGTIPTKPPTRWLERIDKTEPVVDFLRREYSTWLGKGMIRSDLKRIDKSLYDALNNWLSKHGTLPSNIDLPKKREIYDQKIQQAGPLKAPSRSRRASEMGQSEREQVRLYDVARHRKKRED
jgi:hypothetical protein